MTLLERLSAIRHPELDLTLAEAGLVEACGPDSIVLRTLHDADAIQDQVRQIIEGTDARVETIVLTAAERTALGERLAGSAGLGPATRVWHVGASAPGLGRSTLLMGVGRALVQAGQSVAILDASEDQGIWRILRPGGPPTVLGQVVLPRRSEGLSLASVAAFWPGPTPLGWGADEFRTIASRAVQDVLWNAPHVLLVDLPAGLGPRTTAVRGAIAGQLLWVETPLGASAPSGCQRLRSCAPARSGEWGEIPYDPGLAEGGSPGAELARRLRDLARWLLSGAP